MSDILDILMEDPTVKEKMIVKAKKAVEDIVFTKEDITRLRTTMIDMLCEIFNNSDVDDLYYDIQEILAKKMKKTLIDAFSNTKE